MSQLVLDLYTTTWCPDCHIAKRVLVEAGVGYREIDIEQDERAAELVMRHNQGRRRVPTIAIDGRFYGNPSPRELRRLLVGHRAKLAEVVGNPGSAVATPSPDTEPTPDAVAPATNRQELST